MVERRDESIVGRRLTVVVAPVVARVTPQHLSGPLGGLKRTASFGDLSRSSKSSDRRVWSARILSAWSVPSASSPFP